MVDGSILPSLLALVLPPEAALVVSALVVLAIILAWKALKLAFRIAVVAAGVLLILLLLRAAGVDVPVPFL